MSGDSPAEATAPAPAAAAASAVVVPAARSARMWQAAMIASAVGLMAFLYFHPHAAPNISGMLSMTTSSPLVHADGPTLDRPFTVHKCAGSPEDHIAWIQEEHCPCHADMGFTTCLCQLPKPSLDQGCSPMQTSTPAGAATAVHAVKMLVSNAMYVTYAGMMDGSSHPETNACSAITMLGFRRLNNLQWLLEDAIARGVPGGFIETGVWKGGACMLAAAIFRAYGQKGRPVFVADSFQGIPAVNVQDFPADSVHVGMDKMFILTDNSEEAVRGRFERMNLMGTPDYPVQFLKGWFKDTLMPAAQRGDFNSGFAVIRLDGDIYESTWQALEALYPLLHPGGYTIIDDYYDWEGCWKAVRDYRALHNITSSIVPVYHDFSVPGAPEAKRGAWWRKPLDAPPIVRHGSEATYESAAVPSTGYTRLRAQ